MPGTALPGTRPVLCGQNSATLGSGFTHRSVVFDEVLVAFVSDDNSCGLDELLRTLVKLLFAHLRAEVVRFRPVFGLPFCTLLIYLHIAHYVQSHTRPSSSSSTKPKISFSLDVQ